VSIVEVEYVHVATAVVERAPTLTLPSKREREKELLPAGKQRT